MTPPGEVAGVSFAPQAELVFEEDEFNRSRREREKVQKNFDGLDASGTLFKGGFYTTYAARQSRHKAPLPPILAGDSPPSLLAEGVACSSRMDSLDTFNAEMSVSVGKDDPHAYPYYSKDRSGSLGLSSGITDRFGLGRSVNNLPLPLHAIRAKLEIQPRSLSSRNLVVDTIDARASLNEPLVRHDPPIRKKSIGGFTFDRPRTMASRAL